MELRQLEHFVAIAEEESFTRAARRLGYVQSALSVSIRSLERELAVQLFDRTTHRVRLTDAGQALLPSSRATLAAAEAVRDEAAAVHGVLRGTLRIGIMQAFTAVNVPRLLGQFHRQHPRVEVTMRPSVGGTADLLASVANGNLDIAFVAVIDLPKGLRAIPLASEPLALTGRSEDQPTPARSARLQDLSTENFVDFPPGWGVRTIVDRAFTRRGLQRRVGIEVADVATCIQLVREGLGVAILPKSYSAADARGLQTRELSPALSWDIAGVVREGADLSPATAAFTKLVEAATRASAS